MILNARGNLSILWGASVGDTYISAELAYFSSNISYPILKFKNHQTGEIVAKARVPNEYCKLNFPRRATHINLQIMHD